MSKLKLKPEERIIVALDYPEHIKAENLAESLEGVVKTLKIGPILFMDSGPGGIKEFQHKGYEIFLDLKFHDIPSTVEKTARQIVKFGVKMFTVHCLGGIPMLESVSMAVKEESEGLGIPRPAVLAVTVLTSHDKKSLEDIGIASSTGDEVLLLASLAEKSNIDGLVCSGFEVDTLRREFGDRFIYVVHGIRPGTEYQDQKRVTTPAEAVTAGADYMVIGRAITEAKNPVEAVNEIIKSIS